MNAARTYCKFLPFIWKIHFFLIFTILYWLTNELYIYRWYRAADVYTLCGYTPTVPPGFSRRPDKAVLPKPNEPEPQNTTNVNSTCSFRSYQKAFESEWWNGCLCRLIRYSIYWYFPLDTALLTRRLRSNCLIHSVLFLALTVEPVHQILGWGSKTVFSFGHCITNAKIVRYDWLIHSILFLERHCWGSRTTGEFKNATGRKIRRAVTSKEVLASYYVVWKRTGQWASRC